MHFEFVHRICQIGIFIICAQTLTHFRPNASYEKYLKMLVSIMILIQMLKPFGAFWESGREKSLEDSLLWFEKQLEDGMMEAGSGENAFWQQMTMEEVLEKWEMQEGEMIRIENVEVEKIRIDPEEGGVENAGGEQETTARATEKDVEKVVLQR